MSSDGFLFPIEKKGRKQQTGPQAECIRFWEEAWLKEKGYKWAWTPALCANVAKSLSMAGGDLLEWRGRALALIRTQDPFLKRNPTPSGLVHQWNNPVLARAVVRPKPSSPPPESKPRATDPRSCGPPPGWGAKVAATLRDRAGLERVNQELLARTSATPASTAGN